jgi:hypothetical protein
MGTGRNIYEKFILQVASKAKNRKSTGIAPLPQSGIKAYVQSVTAQNLGKKKHLRKIFVRLSCRFTLKRDCFWNAEDDKKILDILISVKNNIRHLNFYEKQY